MTHKDDVSYAMESSVALQSPEVQRDAKGRFVLGTARPIRRRPGGSLGNLNACRNPWRAFWRHRALRPADRWTLLLLADYAGSLVADRGGPETMTAGEAHIRELAQLARGWIMLVLAEAARDSGIVGTRRRGTLKRAPSSQPAAESLSSVERC